MKSASILQISEHRGNPRLWVQGDAPMRAGFTPGAHFEVARHPDGLVVRLAAADGAGPRRARKVSRKVYSSGTEVPVLDINNLEELAPLRGARTVRVIFSDGEMLITPLASETRRLRRLSRLTQKLDAQVQIETAGVASGGGVLTMAVHDGLKAAGLGPHVAFFNEIREDMCDQARSHNPAVSPDTVILNMPLQELAYDDEVMRRIGEVEVVELGLPCSGASRPGRAKRGLRQPEDHPEVGHLAAPGLNMVAKFNPVVAVFENVPEYRFTASASILRQQLRDLAYDVHERLLDANEFGSLEGRSRWVLVAMTRGIPLDISQLPTDIGPRRLGTALLPPDHPDAAWSEMQGLKAKAERDLAEGKNFRMQVFSYDAPFIGTLTKGMARNRSTDPKIQHPDHPHLLRVPMPAEHARCKGIDEGLIAGMSKSAAHQLLGQSVCVNPFRVLARAIGDALKQWHAERDDTARIDVERYRREKVVG